MAFAVESYQSDPSFFQIRRLTENGIWSVTPEFHLPPKMMDKLTNFHNREKALAYAKKLELVKLTI